MTSNPPELRPDVRDAIHWRAQAEGRSVDELVTEFCRTGLARTSRWSRMTGALFVGSLISGIVHISFGVPQEGIGYAAFGFVFGTFFFYWSDRIGKRVRTNFLLGLKEIRATFHVRKT